MGLLKKRGVSNQGIFSYSRMQEALVNESTQELIRLYQPCFENLMVYCMGKCGNVEMAEDAAAETLKAFLEHPNPQEIPNLKAWLLSVAFRKVQKMVEKQARRKRILENRPIERVAEPDISQRLDLDTLEKEIQSILTVQDQAIWKLAKDGYSDVEIGEKLDMNSKTVSNRKSLLKRKIQQKLGGYK